MAAVNECPGSCNFRLREARDAYKAALQAYDPLDPEQSRPELPDIRPVYGTPWCDRDQVVIRRELAELDDLASMLARTATGDRGRRPGAKLPTRKGHGQPSPSPAADMLSELYSTVCEWERASVGEPKARRGYLADARTQALDRLVEHFPTVIVTAVPMVVLADGSKVPFAVAFGKGVRSWHRRLRQLTSAGTGTHHKPVRCPRCEQLSLYWTEGDDHVECRNRACGRLIGLDEYDGLTVKQDEQEIAASSA
jgi:hypothetical protein